jgi:uncharacterized membrane protein YphA (DoxX/SURF4 family)
MIKMKSHNLLLWISRFFVGGLFIFSGFIKANDPVGFSYKLVEYFQVFGMPFLNPLAVPLSIIICILEIVLGVFIILGTLVSFTTFTLLILIIFFTFLTGYSALTGAVSDCGCFGDAIKLTPTQSFIKDLILLAFVSLLFFYRNNISPLLTGRSNKIIVAGSTLAITAFSLYTYFYMPVLDFRPYKVGNDIYALTQVPEDAPIDEYEIKLIYEKEGKLHEFDIASLPEDIADYSWKETKSVLKVAGVRPKITDFSIQNLERVNLTEDFFLQKGYRLVIVQPDLSESNVRAQKKINGLVDEMIHLHPRFFVWALTSSPVGVIEDYKEKNNVSYPMYLSDATVLKTITRANPGLMLLKDNTVVEKWPALNIPSSKEIMELIERN